MDSKNLMLEIHNSFLSVSIDSFGAQLVRIVGEKGTEFLWNGNPAYWSGHAPILFPFVARLYKESYQYKGKQFPMQIHGFASQMQFSVKFLRNDSVTLELVDTEQTRKLYPFHFSFLVIFRLIKNQLTVIYQIKNYGENIMYSGLGSHFGFSVPLDSNKVFEDYHVRFPEAKDCSLRIFSQNLLDTGVEKPFSLTQDGCLLLKHTLFNDDALVLMHSGHKVFLECEGSPQSILVEYPEAPVLAIWQSPHTRAPFICLEPWYALPAKEGEIIDIEKKKDFFSIGSHKIQMNKVLLSFME